MKREQINDLARRLENAHQLSNAERTQLLKDLERYARHDLYGAARLCKDHLKEHADFRPPTVVMAADRIAKSFEMRIKEHRRPVELYGEQDRQIRQPEDGREYRGPIIGTTPNCVVQRDLDSGDLIVHARGSLARQFEAQDADRDLSIHYPFKAVGGVGLVKEAEHAHQAEHQASFERVPAQAQHAKTMEFSR